MDPKVVALYDEYTHAPLPRRTFLERLATLAGGTAAAYALLPMLENDYARAAIVAPDDARIAAERVPIRLPGGEMRAYVAVPRDGPAKRAGVIVIHENRGLNPHIEDVARRVALAGFTAIGVDMLSAQGGTPADEDRARGMIAKVDRAAAIADLSAVVDWLRARPDANGRVGAIGFCWGGGMANALAAAVPSLDAAVPFYGVAPPSADVARIRARLLLHYAATTRGSTPASRATRPHSRLRASRTRRTSTKVPSTRSTATPRARATTRPPRSSRGRERSRSCARYSVTPPRAARASSRARAARARADFVSSGLVLQLDEAAEDVALGDDADDRAAIEDREAADAMLEHQARGVAQAHARRRGDELRRHELADVDARARVACRREQQIPLGDDPTSRRSRSTTGRRRRRFSCMSWSAC